MCSKPPSSKADRGEGAKPEDQKEGNAEKEKGQRKGGERSRKRGLAAGPVSSAPAVAQGPLPLPFAEKIQVGTRVCL